MSDLQRWTRCYNFQKYLQCQWNLKVFLIKYDSDESVNDDDIKSIIERCLTDVEKHCVSPEFQYFRIGFAFLHYGARGVNLTVVHYGSWGNTCEMFMNSWYCYGRDISEMELLNSSEPVMSQYEFCYFLNELSAVVTKVTNNYDSIESILRKLPQLGD